MNIDNIKNAIGNIDDDLIEAADAEPAAAPVKAFKPWLKWVAAAAAFFIVAIVPLALLSMGAFQTPNVAQRYQSEGSVGEEPGIISSSDSGEPENSSASEPNSADTVSSSGETPPKSDDRSGGRSGKTPSANNVQPQQGGGESGPGQDGAEQPPAAPDDPEPPHEDPPEQTEGEFIKDDMPEVMYVIAGENKTFSYMSSTRSKRAAEMDLDGKEGTRVIDHYVSSDGSMISKNECSDELLEYEKDIMTVDMTIERISEFDAIDIAKYAVMNTEIPIGKLDSIIASVRYLPGRYYITFKTADGSVEVCLDNQGVLQYMAVKKDVRQQLSADRIAGAIDKLFTELDKLNNNDPNGRYVMERMNFEEWGDKIYAVFDVAYYPDKNSDTHSVYQYYCVA